MKDPALLKCSEATRGIWIDFLCVMHEDNRSGNVTGTPEQLCRAGRTTAAVLVQALSELSTSGAAQVNERNGIISVTNRRMSRERRAREYERLRKQDQRVRRKSQTCPDPLSMSLSVSKEREPKSGSLSQPSRIGQSAPKDRKDARNTSEREPKSRFSLKECEQYAATLKRIKSPKAYGKTIWRSGEDDDAVGEFIGHSGEPIKKPPPPVDVGELQRLAAELDAMGLDKQAEAVRAGIQAK